MFGNVVSTMANKWSETIEGILKKELISIGFDEDFNEENIRNFINENDIELYIDNTPLLTTYKAIRRCTNEELFAFQVKSTLSEENEKWYVRTEFLRL